MKEEALKLADEIDNFYKHNNQPYFLIQLQAMIRRLVEELDRLVGAEPITHGKLTFCKNCGQQDPYTQTKPLSDEEIDEVSKAIWERPWLEKHREFARAIEERHGIHVQKT